MSVLAGPFTFARGETIALALLVEAGDPGTVTAATAKMQRLRNNAMDGTPIDLTVTFVAAAAPDPAMWLLSLSAAASAALAIGSYQVDAKFVQGSKADITDSAQVRLVEAASS